MFADCGFMLVEHMWFIPVNKRGIKVVSLWLPGSLIHSTIEIDALELPGDPFPGEAGNGWGPLKGHDLLTTCLVTVSTLLATKNADIKFKKSLGLVPFEEHSHQSWCCRPVVGCTPLIQQHLALVPI